MNRIRLFFWTRFAFNALVSEDFERAGSYFEKIRNRCPDRMGTRYNLGLACLGMERFEEAEGAFSGEIRRFGESPERVRALGDLYYIWGKGEQAHACYRKVTGMQPSPLLEERVALLEREDGPERIRKAHSTFKEGVEAMKGGHGERAIREFRKTVDFDPTHFQALNNLGTLFLDKGEAAAAVGWFEAALALAEMRPVRENLLRARQAMDGAAP